MQTVKPGEQAEGGVQREQRGSAIMSGLQTSF